MKISVITVCYNAAEELEATMLSVLEQTHPDVEYIVIDGGSTDGSVEIIKKYSDRLSYWVSEPDRGIYDAMNKGIQAATGQYINFMNAGDRFASIDVLSMVSNEKPNATVIYGNTRLHERGLEYIIAPTNIEQKMKNRMCLCHQSIFVDTDYHKNHLFDLSFKSSADYNLFYHALFSDKVPFQHLDITISDYDESVGFSKSNLSRTYRERYKIWGIEDKPCKILLLEIKLQYRILMDRIKRHMPLELLRHYRS